MKKIFYIPVLAAAVSLFALHACEKPTTTGTDNPVREVLVSNSGTENTFELTEGDTRQVEVTVSPADAGDKNDYGSYTFKSSNPAVFTVDESGLITATGAGEAVLSVTPVNNGDIWATSMVVVAKKLYPVTSIELNEKFKEYYAEIGATIDISEQYTLLPENASNKMVVYSSSNEEVATIDESGMIVIRDVLGDTVISVESTDGSETKDEMNLHVRNFIYEPFERTGWAVTTSHPYFYDGTVIGRPECLIDGLRRNGGGVTETCLCLVKFGRSNIAIGDGRDPLTIATDDPVFFVVDMGEKKNFDYFQWCHRAGNTSANLRPTKITVLGSNDTGEDKTWNTILDNETMATNVSDVYFKLPQKYEYRYFKAWITGVASGGNTVQISEIYIGTIGYEPLPVE